MARIRTVKPEFFSDEKLAPLPVIDRFVFLGLICMADDKGRLVDNVRTIDALIFPESPDVSSAASIDKLVALGRIRRGVTESGQKLIEVVNFTRHQLIQHPAKYNLPPIVTQVVPQPQVANVSCDPHETLMRTAGESPETLTHDLRSSISDLRSPISDQNTSPAATVPAEQPSLALVLPDRPAVPQPPPPVLAVVNALGRVRRASDESAERVDRSRSLRQLIFAYWQQVHRHPAARWKPDGIVDRKIRQRLAEDGGDPNRCLYAIDGAKHDDWLMGKSGGRKYDGLETLFRDEAITTRLAECKSGFGRGEPHPFLRDIDEQMGGAAVEA